VHLQRTRSLRVFFKLLMLTHDCPVNMGLNQTGVESALHSFCWSCSEHTKSSKTVNSQLVKTIVWIFIEKRFRSEISCNPCFPVILFSMIHQPTREMAEKIPRRTHNQPDIKDPKVTTYKTQWKNKQPRFALFARTFSHSEPSRYTHSVT
jgi:hypothetical protein